MIHCILVSGTVAGDGSWSASVTPAQAQLLVDGGYTVSAAVSSLAGNPAIPATEFPRLPEPGDGLGPGSSCPAAPTDSSRASDFR